MIRERGELACPDDEFPNYVLLTDAPPFQEGHGCHVVAWNWIQMATPNVKLVITHRLNRTLSTEEIANNAPAPVTFYGDLSKLRWPRLFQPVKSLLEVVLFMVALPRLLGRIRAAGVERLFALFGGDPWFLVPAYCLHRWSRLPLDIYLVDDLEESTQLANQGLISPLVRWMEARVLARAQRVFTISPGYAEHLNRKYKIRAEWLPLPVPPLPITYAPFVPRPADIRTLAFIGAVNPLYVGGLRDVLQMIEEWNGGKNAFDLRFLLFTYTSPEYIETQLGRSKYLEVRFEANTEKFQKQLRECWAIIVPSSFEEQVRLMVSTSFPSKIVASFLIGRPIVVYGPEYASLPRYFRDNGLPLCANSPSQLKTVLQELEQYDTPAIVERYRSVIHRLHFREHLRALLQDRPKAEVAYPSGC